MKVKVDERVFNAISYWRQHYTSDKIVHDFLLRRHMNIPYFTNTYRCLNQVSTEELLDIVIHGYELEEAEQ